MTRYQENPERIRRAALNQVYGSGEFKFAPPAETLGAEIRILLEEQIQAVPDSRRFLDVAYSMKGNGSLVLRPTEHIVDAKGIEHHKPRRIFRVFNNTNEVITEITTIIPPDRGGDQAARKQENEPMNSELSLTVRSTLPRNGHQPDLSGPLYEVVLNSHTPGQELRGIEALNYLQCHFTDDLHRLPNPTQTKDISKPR